MRQFGLLILLVFLLVSPAHSQENNQELRLKMVVFPIQRAVVSAGVNSVLTKHTFKEGEIFAKGATLVTLDKRPYSQAVIIEKQNLAERKKQLSYTEKELERFRELHRSKLAGDHDLEEARLKREIAAIRRQRSEAQLKLATYKLEKCRIIAPFAGRLTAIMAREHEFVQTGQPLIEIINDQQLLAVIHVPSRLRPKINTDMKLTIRVDETEKEYSGEVYSIGATIDPGSRTVEVKIALDNSNRELSGGMSGEVLITIQ